MMRVDIIQRWLTAKGYEALTAQEIDVLKKYQERLLNVNEHMNLTAITDDADIAVKHFIDSMTLLPWVKQMPEGGKLLDIGAGAGFPGLVLKIMQPDISITLLDSLRKRIFFLQETADMLGIKKVECIHARAEELMRNPSHSKQYTIVTARAVARLHKLAGYALPFLKEDGVFLAMKGRDVKDELKEAQPVFKKHGCVLAEACAVDISDEIRHTVVVVVRVWGGCKYG